jgi:signal peptidase I
MAVTCIQWALTASFFRNGASFIVANPLRRENMSLDAPAFEEGTSSPSNRKPGEKGIVREWAESLAFTLLFVLFLTTFVAQATEVPSESMLPTILVGDHFLLDKLAFPANYPDFLREILPVRHIERGDIVAFKSQEKDSQAPRLIKRVIGLPGETIEIWDKAVFINHQRLQEPYAQFVDTRTYRKELGVPYDYARRDNYGPLVIPADSYFVMGDNRDSSYDSRFWGTVPRNDIIGKPLFDRVYWSFETEPEAAYPRTFLERVRDSGFVAMHFFSKTRWTRIGAVLK